MRTPVVKWVNRYVAGWNGAISTPDQEVDSNFVDKNGRPLIKNNVCNLDDLLDQVHETDAHFVPHHPVYKGQVMPTCYRLRKPCLPTLSKMNVEIRFGAIVLDVDDKSVGHGKQAANDAWRAEQREFWSRLPANLSSGMAWYETNGGYRLLWRLEPSLSMCEYKDLLVALQYCMATMYSIGADALFDWTRCYRLPRVLRTFDVKTNDYVADGDDGRQSTPASALVRTYKQQEMPGDWSNLGPLLWRPTSELMKQARMNSLRAFEVARDSTTPDIPGRPRGTPYIQGADTSLSIEERVFGGLGSAKTDSFTLPDQIPEHGSGNTGGRNQMMFQYAGWLHTQNLTFEQLRLTLHSTNLKRCIPPLEEEVVDDIARRMVSEYDGNTRKNGQLGKVRIPVARQASTVSVDFLAAKNLNATHAKVEIPARAIPAADARRIVSIPQIVAEPDKAVGPSVSIPPQRLRTFIVTRKK